ncbi:MAG: metallophosphoesterase [Armatimonadota bacterium]|nr:metallophosphoesterase [Armatimonadota bacterium]
MKIIAHTLRRVRPVTALLAAILALCGPLARAQSFTIPVLPDTQVEVNYKPAMFTSQLDWIVKNKTALHIPIVLHVGDIVDWNNVQQWERASAGFQTLDKAQIPYALAVGNHDTAAVGEFSGSAAPGNVNANLRNTEKFNTYFPVSRFTAQRGRYEPGKSDNAFYTFSAGGLNWLVLTLEFCARQGPVDWANGVLSAHPKDNVIVLTHFHLNSQGEINPNNAGYGNLTTQSVYDQLIKKHANVVLVLSGHVDSSAHRTDTGEAGNTIYQILQDYQTQDAGGGYIRLLDINPQAGTISARMYSPFYDKTKEDASQFTLTGVKFITK